MSDIMSDFARLLEDQIPRLRRYARALTRDSTRADDLVQSCLVRALAKQHLWEPGTDLRAWLFTILHNQHVNDRRSALRESVCISGEASVPIPAAPNAIASLELRDLEPRLSGLAVVPLERQLRRVEIGWRLGFEETIQA